MRKPRITAIAGLIAVALLVAVAAILGVRWLMRRRHAASSPTPTPAASPNDTVVKGTTGAITDTSGRNWTITAGGQVAINGVADTTTANVIELAYVNATIWQENSSNLWWGETQPNDAWASVTGMAAAELRRGR